MNAQDLKNSILQLAIQGKLVEQREEESTAKELLERIEAEKNQLIQEGKIKNQKDLPAINEDEIPFDIPESWEWVRLGDCVSNKSGVSYKKENLSIKTEHMVRILRGGNIADLEYFFKDDDIIIDSAFVKDELLLKKNTLITPAVTSLQHIGKMARIEKAHRNVAVGGFVLMLLPHIDLDIFSQYLLFALSSHYHRSICRSITNKSGQAFYNLSREKLMNVLVPIPPLEEQKRIISKIGELMLFVDKYDKIYYEMEGLNKKFPEDMQKSILKYAIQGKLVEQRKEDGTAEELYKHIQEEKKKLIQEGKIKKTKQLMEITDDEIPFDIPENWKWVRLGELVSFYGGYAYKSSTYIDESNNMIIRLGNVKNDKILLDVNPVFIPQDIAEATSKYKILPKDILFTMTGTRKKRDYFYTTLIDEEDLKKFELFLNQRVGCLRNDCKIVNMRWLSFALKSEGVLSQIFSFETGTANQGNIGSDNTMKLMIPFPPLNEQKRIVEKIEELLPYTKKLVK